MNTPNVLAACLALGTAAFVPLAAQTPEVDAVLDKPGDYVGTNAAPAQEPALEAVLQRAGAYVLEFQRQLSGIVAEEHYLQDVRTAPTAMGRMLSTSTQVSHRELTSDFLLVKPIGSDRYVEFRDVFDVDGKPVRDRDQRLAKLFLEPTLSGFAQIQSIVADSTRYNIGNLERTVNVPVMALLFLDPENQRRFRFTRTDDASAPMALKPPASAWIVHYEETTKRTMITTTNALDLPARGRFWIEPASGRVLMSEITVEDVRLRGTIVVRYETQAAVELLVPAEMRERYDMRRDGIRIDGVATYTRFRRFQVTVDEKLAPIVKQ